MMITFARAAAANSLLPVFRRGVWRCVPTAHCPVPTLSLVSLSLFSLTVQTHQLYFRLLCFSLSYSDNDTTTSPIYLRCASRFLKLTLISALRSQRCPSIPPQTTCRGHRAGGARRIRPYTAAAFSARTYASPPSLQKAGAKGHHHHR